MRHLRCTSLVAACAFIIPSHACLNDRDSLLAGQRQEYLEAEVLTGWFDRNPPRYYQMRIDRLEKKSKLSPPELDDLAVAYERLGKGKMAMQVIDRKLKLGKPGYTYYANHGTFLIHEWIRSGSEDLGPARQAEKEIAKAIEIYPEAHRGREGAQLEAIRWLIRFKSGEKNPPSYGEAMKEACNRRPPTEAQSLLTGLVGLVELGGAWEAVDHYAAIATLRRGYRESDVAHFRAKELLAAGKNPLYPDGVKRDLARLVVEPAPGVAQEAYDITRRDAERRFELRNAFMESRFAKGMHPDTDPSFWNGWKEPAKTPFFQSPHRAGDKPNPVAIIASSGGGIAVIVAAIYLYRRSKRVKDVLRY